MNAQIPKGDGKPRVLPAAQLTTMETPFSVQTWVSATFLLVFTTLLSKGLGFMRDVMVANYFGATAQVDAFMVAVTLSTLAAGIGSALASTLVPAYRQALATQGPTDAKRLASGVVGLTLVLTLGVILVLLTSPWSFVRLIAPALPPATHELAGELVQWLAGLIFGINMIYILSAVYNALEHFKIPCLMDLASNVFVLLILFLFASILGIRALALGLGMGTVIVTTALAIPIFARGIVSLSVDFRNPAVRKMAVLAVPVFLWELVSQGTTILENFFGARLEAGSIAALAYAKRLSVLVVSLLAVNIARAVFPVLSRLVSERRLGDAKDLLMKLSRQYLVVFIPISVGLIYFRHEVVSVIFLRGEFDATAAARTSAVLLYYSAGIIILAAIPICIRASYAFADTRTPLLANSVGLVALAGLNYLLTPKLGVTGIALSTSLSLALSVAIMGEVLRRRFQGLRLIELAKVGGLSTLCSLVAVIPVIVVRMILPATQSGLGGLTVGWCVFALAYFLLGWFLMQREVRTLAFLLRNQL